MITEVFVVEEFVVEEVEVDDVDVLAIEPDQSDHHQEAVEVDVQPGTQVVPGKDHPPPHNW